MNYKMTAIFFLKTKDLIMPLVLCTKGPSLWANFGRDGCSLCPSREGFLQELMHHHAQSQSAGTALNGADSSVSQERLTLQKRLCCGFPGSWARRDRPRPVLPRCSAALSGARAESPPGEHRPTREQLRGAHGAHSPLALGISQAQLNLSARAVQMRIKPWCCLKAPSQQAPQPDSINRYRRHWIEFPPTALSSSSSQTSSLSKWHCQPTHRETWSYTPWALVSNLFATFTYMWIQAIR